MTRSELQGKIRIKLKITADLGLCTRVGFLLLLVRVINDFGPARRLEQVISAANRNVEEV